MMGRRRRVPLVFSAWERRGFLRLKDSGSGSVGGEVNGTVHGTWGIRSIPRPRGTRLGLLGASTRFGRVRRGGGRIRSSFGGHVLRSRARARPRRWTDVARTYGWTVRALRFLGFSSPADFRVDP